MAERRPRDGWSWRSVVAGASIAAGLAVVGGGVLAASVAPAAAHPGHPVDYRWVDGSSVEVATGRRATLPVGMATDVWTPDSQAVLTLPEGALAAPDGAAQADVEVEPVDAAELGRLPRGYAPGGNAYRVDLHLVAPGRILLAVPHEAAAVLHSPDGATWEPLEHTEAPGMGVTAPLEAAGYYLVAADAEGGGWRVPVLTALAGGALLAVARHRRRRDRTPSPA